jgi:hypothetical protein
MASHLRRLWAALWAPFERRFGEKWVEPGNAITRAIAAGVIPATYPIEDVASIPAVPVFDPISAPTGEIVSPPVAEQQPKARRRRPRRAA